MKKELKNKQANKPTPSTTPSHQKKNQLKPKKTTQCGDGNSSVMGQIPSLSNHMLPSSGLSRG